MMFVSEHPGLIFIGMILFFIFWVTVMISKIRLHSKFKRILKENDAEQRDLRNLSYQRSQVIDLLIMAVKGWGNSSHNPYSYLFDGSPNIGMPCREIDDKKLKELVNHREVTDGLWHETIRGLDLIWAVHHINYLLKEAKERVEKGRRENTGILGTYHVKDIAEDFQKHLNAIRPRLISQIGEAATEAFIAYAGPLMDPIILAGHQKEAKELAEHIRLYSFHVDLYDIKRLIDHCRAANLDAYTLFLPKYHDMLRSLIETVEKLEQRETDERATSEVAQS